MPMSKNTQPSANPLCAAWNKVYAWFTTPVEPVRKIGPKNDWAWFETNDPTVF